METSDQEGSRYWKKFRKKKLINPEFQLSFMRYFVSIAIVTLAVFYGAKVFFFHEVRAYLSTLGFQPDHALFDFLSRQSHVMDGIFFAAAVIECAFLAWMGLKISHRVAGPLYRLKSEMLRAARGGGEVKPLKFRDGDYFAELADAYNEQMGEIRKSSKVA